MSDLGTPEIIGISAVCMFLLRLLEKLIDRLLQKNGKVKDDGDDSAGKKNVEFWQREYDKQADRVIDGTIIAVSKAEDRLMKRLDDLYAALQILIRWKGGD